MIDLTENELLLRLRSTEDNFTERKSSGDVKDALKTVVAFANSTPIGYPAVLFLGVKNDGTPELEVNLDTLQKTLDQKVVLAFPPIYYVTKIIRERGHEVLAVIVPGSENRPHFSGKAFVRRGSKSVDASEREFQTLIAQRSSVVYEILKYRNQQVSFHFTDQWGQSPHQGTLAELVDCNPFYVTLNYNGQNWSYSLRKVDLSFDHQKRLFVLGISHR